MANALEVTLHASGAESSTGTGSAVDLGAARTALVATIAVSAVSGTDPTVEVTLEHSDDGATGWQAFAAFNALTGIADVERAFAGVKRYVRASWVLGGSAGPSVTFSVLGVAHQLFALRKHLFARIPEPALANVPDDEIAKALIAASGDAEDAIGTAYPLPLARTTESIGRRTGAIAAYLIMGATGFKPTGIDELIVKDHDDAQRWLRAVASGSIHIQELEQLDAAEPSAQAVIVSSAPRGWT